VVGGQESEAGLGQKHKTLPEKQTKTKKAGGMAQVAEHLPVNSGP
jgi:hypothetical protein